MENNIEKSSLKTKEEIVSDLNNLLQLVNDGKEGYQHAAEKTESPELKAIFLKLSGERIVYAEELKEHIATHGGEADNEAGGVLGGLHRGWITIKEAFTGNDNKALIEAIETGEKAAIAKYDEYIADYLDHADHLELLKSQREGIQTALSEVENLKGAYNS
jgi:uncharacterized protein (TIGR02284 family)